MRALALLVLAACSPVDAFDTESSRVACHRYGECKGFDAEFTAADCVEEVTAWTRMVSDCSAPACDFDAESARACIANSRDEPCATVGNGDAPADPACEATWYNCDMEIVNRCIDDAVYGPG